MAKVLNCGDVLAGCTARIVGSTEQEVMTREAEHAARAHGLAELTPELQAKIVSRIVGSHDGPGDQEYAHVNIWRLAAGDQPTDTTAARAIAGHLRRQPGFRSYSLIRTGEHEVVAVTVFDSEEHLRAAVEAVAGLVRERVTPLAASAPRRRQGRVVYHEAA